MRLVTTEIQSRAMDGSARWVVRSDVGESGEIMAGELEDEAADIGLYENVVGEVEIGVCRRGWGRRPGAGELAFAKSLRTGNQAAGSRQHEWRELAHRQTKHIRGGDFMRISGPRRVRH